MRNEYLMKIFYPFIGNKYYLLNETASVTMCNLTGTSAIRTRFCCWRHSMVSNSTNTAGRGHTAPPESTAMLLFQRSMCFTSGTCCDILSQMAVVAYWCSGVAVGYGVGGFLPVSLAVPEVARLVLCPKK